MGCFPCFGGSKKQSNKKINSNNQQDDQADSASGFLFFLFKFGFFSKKIMNFS